MADPDNEDAEAPDPDSGPSWGAWFGKRLGFGGPSHDTVLYKVGSVFRHRRYGYEGMIVGWDTRCEKDEAWISHMGVDQLPGGKEQSFYHVV